MDFTKSMTLEGVLDALGDLDYAVRKGGALRLAFLLNLNLVTVAEVVKTLKDGETDEQVSVELGRMLVPMHGRFLCSLEAYSPYMSCLRQHHRFWRMATDSDDDDRARKLEHLRDEAEVDSNAMTAASWELANPTIPVSFERLMEMKGEHQDRLDRMDERDEQSEE